MLKKKIPQRWQKTRCNYVTYRQGSSIFFENFEALEYQLLQAFLGGATLGQVLTTYENEHISEKLFTYLSQMADVPINY